eukprot:760647-Hanusia_phi.AAC.2
MPGGDSENAANLPEAMPYSSFMSAVSLIPMLPDLCIARPQAPVLISIRAWPLRCMRLLRNTSPSFLASAGPRGGHGEGDSSSGECGKILSEGKDPTAHWFVTGSQCVSSRRPEPSQDGYGHR